VTWTACSDMDCLQWHGLRAVTWTACSDMDCVQWHGLLSVTWTACSDMDCVQWHRLRGVTWTACSDMDCFQWHGLRAVTWTACSDMDCVEWHGLLSVTWTACSDMECFQWHGLPAVEKILQCHWSQSIKHPCIYGADYVGSSKHYLHRKFLCIRRTFCAFITQYDFNIYSPILLDSIKRYIFLIVQLTPFLLYN
jgi:hypothetical protein